MSDPIPVHVWLDNQVTPTNTGTPQPTLVVKVHDHHYKLSMKYLTENARKVTVMKGAAKVATQKKELEEDLALLAKEKEHLTALFNAVEEETKTRRAELLEELGERESNLQKQEKELGNERLILGCMRAKLDKEKKRLGLDYETTKEIGKRLREAEVVAVNANAIFNHAEDMTIKLAKKEAQVARLKKKLERRFDAIEGFMTGNLRVAVKELVG